MRGLGMLFVMSGCILIGLWHRALYLRKSRNLLTFQKGIGILEGEISYGRTPLPDAFCEMAKRTSGRVSVFFDEVSGKLESGTGEFSDIWSGAIEKMFRERELGTEDRHELEELGNTLGYLDVDMQLQALKLYQSRLDQSIRSWEREKEKRTRLYPILGVISGLLICLLFL